MRFIVQLRSVRTEQMTLSIEADNLEQAEDKAEELKKNARAYGGWESIEDFVDVEKVETAIDFQPTHIFTLPNDSEVSVMVEQRGDPIALEEDGTRWVTNMGTEELWWVCPSRKVYNVKAVRKVQPPTESAKPKKARKKSRR